jgi:hypothetical protein
VNHIELQMQFNWVASTANDAFWSNKSNHVTEQNFIILSSSLKSQCAPLLCLYFLRSLQPDPLEEETAKEEHMIIIHSQEHHPRHLNG